MRLVIEADDYEEEGWFSRDVLGAGGLPLTAFEELVGDEAPED